MIAAHRRRAARAAAPPVPSLERPPVPDAEAEGAPDAPPARTVETPPDPRSKRR